MGTFTARKTIFPFSKCSEKIAFPKKLHWYMITGIWYFLYHQERWYFFSPKIWSYYLGGKWKMIFLKKYIEIWYILQMFWKDDLSTKIAAEYDLSSIIRNDSISFSQKYDIFLRTENERWSFAKNTSEYDVFSIFGKDGISFPANRKLLFCQKSKDDLFAKNTP